MTVICAVPSKAKKLVRISDVAQTASGTTPSRSQADYWQPPEVPWVKTGEIAFAPIRLVEEAVSRKAINDCSLPLLPPGTVLVAMYGQGKTRGQSAVLEISATTNQACFAVLPNETFVAEYLQYWFRYSYASIRSASEGRGGNQSNLSGDMLKALEVPWVEPTEQRTIAGKLALKLEAAENARQAALMQLREISNLAGAIVLDTIRNSPTEPWVLGDVLDEVKHGIGAGWADHPVLGATREGLAPAKEQPGKMAPKYKPVTPGTVFYNPMRILIGSIAFVDDDDAPGITSPDYVVLRGKPGLVDSRWFYYWLRSHLGAQCILSLARGAVRERMLFNRLADGKIDLPSPEAQEKASRALRELKPLQSALKSKLAEIDLLPQKILAQAFEM